MIKAYGIDEKNVKSQADIPDSIRRNYLYYKGLLHPAKRFCRIRPIIGLNGSNGAFYSSLDAQPHQSSSDRIVVMPIGLPGGADLARGGEN